MPLELPLVMISKSSIVLAINLLLASNALGAAICVNSVSEITTFTMTPEMNSLKVIRHGDRITLDWSKIVDRVESQIIKNRGAGVGGTVPGKPIITASILVNGIEAIKDLPRNQTRINLFAKEGQQNAYYVTFKEMQNGVEYPIHQTELKLLESLNIQSVAPESFKNIIEDHLLNVDIQPDSFLGQRGVNPELTKAAMTIGYNKVVYVASRFASPEIVGLIQNLGENLVVEATLNDRDEPINYKLSEKKSDGSKTLLPGFENVSPENFIMKVDAAFNGNSFFWDDMFVALSTALHHPWLAKSTLEFWLQVQEAHGGIIPREVIKSTMLSLWPDKIIRTGEGPKENLQYTNPYLMNWVAETIYKLDPSPENFKLLERVNKSMENYAQQIENRRAIRENSEIIGLTTNALGSGKDNSRGSRGNDHSAKSYQSGWVDMLAQHISMYKSMGRTFQMMAQVSEKEGDNTNALKLLNLSKEKFKKANRFVEILNAKYYDPDRGFYFDLIWNGSEFVRDTKFPSVAGFWPLYAKAATPEQVQKIIQMQMTPEKFGGEYPMPANARDYARSVNKNTEEDGYWDLDAMWAPMLAMAAEGFSQSGRPDVAFEISVNFLKMMSEASARFKSVLGRETVMELYGLAQEVQPDGYTKMEGRRGQHGVHQTRFDFAGWGKVPVVYNLLMHVIGLSPQARGYMRWNLMVPMKLNETLQVQNLYYRNSRIKELGIKKLADNKIEIQVRSDKAFDLELHSFVKKGALAPTSQENSVSNRIRIGGSDILQTYVVPLSLLQ